MVIKRFSNMLGSRHGANPFSRGRRDGATPADDDGGDAAVLHGGAGGVDESTPEGAAARGVRLFCESGGPSNQGDEVLHLPGIVEAAESSPAAAGVAAQQIRRFLSKTHYSTPHAQYNAIMLVRILADNPGPTFTRHLDAKFAATVKQLLRDGRDQSVQQLLRETLQMLYMEKAYDTNLAPLFQMWSKESGFNIAQSARAAGSQPQPPRPPIAAAAPPSLPPPVELAARMEEAKTSAKLLQQLVQSTPPASLQSSELVREFAERCQNAQKSMQMLLNAANPAPDDDTMQALIETSEQLSLAASKHQRAVLQARRAGHAPNHPSTSNYVSTSTYPPALSSNDPPALSSNDPPALSSNDPPALSSNPPPALFNTHPPAGAGFSHPGQPPAATTVSTESSETDIYQPPPLPPPGALRDSLDRPQLPRSARPPSLAQPPSLGRPPSLAQPPSLAPPRGLAQPPSVNPPQLPPIRTSDADPFSDAHERVRDYSQAPLVTPPIQQSQPQSQIQSQDLAEYPVPSQHQPHHTRSPPSHPASDARPPPTAYDSSLAAASTVAVLGVRAPPPRVVDYAHGLSEPADSTRPAREYTNARLVAGSGENRAYKGPGEYPGAGKVSPLEETYGYGYPTGGARGADGGAAGAGARVRARQGAGTDGEAR